MPSKHASRSGEPPEAGSGTLYVVATPIGNLADITLRALDVLRRVDRIAAEDTRHTRKLLSHYDIHRPLVSYHSHNREKRGPELLHRMRSGESIALVTDAGTPGISDPGTLLVHQALEVELPVVVIPGPTALIAALVASGLPTHPFSFLGFPPARGPGRRRFFASTAALAMTLLLYESPQRLQRTLHDMLHAWGDRRIAIARELTKQYEEVFRGVISEAQAYYAEAPRGELTLVIAGASASDEEKTGEGHSEWQEELRQLLSRPGMSVREASDRMVQQHGLSRRLVYQEALRIKGS